MSQPIYQDETIAIALPQPPAAKGHMVISSPKTQLTQMNAAELHDFFYTASFGATALFELLKAQGSNVIVHEEQDKLEAHVIARFENDGLNFMWQPQQGNPEELDTLAKQIKDKVDILIWEQEHPEEAAKAKAPKVQPQATVLKEEPSTDADNSKEPKTNYLLKNLRRHG